MMLEILGEEKASRIVEEAMKKTILNMDGMDAGKMGMSTSEVGDSVANNVAIL